ncbi:MAG: tetraacyldisaccharide 4'-kinase [Nitrosomonadales bacterium]|nr:tetraacyldisaccharide 4'-kinase [Nitrosomonadales bacterium]
MHGLQHYWHRITPLLLILFPVSLLFRLLVALRRALYRSGILPSQKLAVPVIVVGNVSVGGTGKTPLTLALAQQLIQRGRHPLIVSRGYGGAAQQPQQVETNSNAQQVGDEPLLMARRNLCPVWIGKDRAAAAQAALQAHPQCDVVLCDDGLQHYRLQRDVEVAVVDGARGFGNGFMLPAGPLREPVSRLRTVDAVVVNGGNDMPLNSLSSVQAEIVEARADTAPCPSTSSGRTVKNDHRYAMRLSGKTFYNLLNPTQTATADHFHALNNHAVAGIGHPQRYFEHLQAMGISFMPHAFPDHHPYLETDLAFTGCDAILLTEKDAVKCAAFADARYWVLRVDAEIDITLIDHILRKITSHGCKTA